MQLRPGLAIRPPSDSAWQNARLFNSVKGLGFDVTQRLGANTALAIFRGPQPRGSIDSIMRALGHPTRRCLWTDEIELCVSPSKCERFVTQGHLTAPRLIASPLEPAAPMLNRRSRPPDTPAPHSFQLLRNPMHLLIGDKSTMDANRCRFLEGGTACHHGRAVARLPSGPAPFANPPATNLKSDTGRNIGFYQPCNHIDRRSLCCQNQGIPAAGSGLFALSALQSSCHDHNEVCKFIHDNTT